METRRGGAGPDRLRDAVDRGRPRDGADAGRVQPRLAVRAALRRRRDGRLPRRRAASPARRPARGPAYYDLSTADGVPYWQIALLHLDSLASTVLQTCAYWGNDDQCTFCGIGVSLAAGRTIARKTPEQLAEVAVAAKELDGAVDATLTTGQHARRPTRARSTSRRCGQAVKEASGLPVEVQFEPLDDLDVIDQVARHGDRLGRHPRRVLRPRRAGPHRAGQGPHRASTATSRRGSARSRCSATGQVSTYVILGMGEDPDLTVAGCKRAIDMGVYPFVVPLRPSPAASWRTGRRPRRSTPRPSTGRSCPTCWRAASAPRGVSAGCARCQACSAMGALERSLTTTAGSPRWPSRRPPDRALARLRRSAPAHRAALRARADAGGACRAPCDPAPGVRRGAGALRRLRPRRPRRRGRDAGRAGAGATGLPVGVVRLYPLDDQGLWLGDRLAVLAPHRAHGLGAPLVRFAVATAGALGGHRCWPTSSCRTSRSSSTWAGSASGRSRPTSGVPHQTMRIALARLGEPRDGVDREVEHCCLVGPAAQPEAPGRVEGADRRGGDPAVVERRERVGLALRRHAEQERVPGEAAQPRREVEVGWAGQQVDVERHAETGWAPAASRASPRCRPC